MKSVKFVKFISCLLALILCFQLVTLCSCGTPGNDVPSSEEGSTQEPGFEDIDGETETIPDPASETIDVGIAWRENTDTDAYSSLVEALLLCGLNPIPLDQVIDDDLEYGADNRISNDGVDKNGFLSSDYASIIKMRSYQDSNVTDILKNVRAVIFSGGEDISPTLFKKAEGFHGIEKEKDYNPTRDVSDYLLMSYCLDQDIPVLGICRGMQMLSIVSGASMIQDIETFCKQQGIAYNYEHRGFGKDGEKDYACHNVNITVPDSLTYQMFKKDVLTGAPSLHHQAVRSTENTSLLITGITSVGGYDFIEMVERSDKTFAIGLQFHPEVAVSKNLEGTDDMARYMSLEDASNPFNFLLEYVTLDVPASDAETD